MLSKKEILKKQKSPYLYIDDNVIDGSIESVYEAMDEYAKCDAIEFCEWMQRYSLYDYSKKPYIYAGRQQPNRKSKPETWTAAKLYELYLQQTKK